MVRDGHPATTNLGELKIARRRMGVANEPLNGVSTHVRPLCDHDERPIVVREVAVEVVFDLVELGIVVALDNLDVFHHFFS